MDLLKVLLVGSIFYSFGCQLPYLAQSAYHQGKHLIKREKIQDVLSDNEVSAEEKRKLKIAQEARKFAEENLGLKVEDNYTSFVKLDHPFLSYVVNASKKFELKNYYWYFPIVGDVPYKGFPNPKDAESESEELKKQGYDTYVRGVAAYSTLGWFADPVYSSMLRYSDHNLVNTIIHESVHATIYIKSNADFNESLASFIGDVGTEMYYLKKEGANSPTLALIKDENADSKLFNDWIKGQLEALNKFYMNLELQTEPMRQTAFERIKKNFEADVPPYLKTNQYKKFSETPLNNARLLLYQTYSSDSNDFHVLFNLCGEKINCFMEKIQLLANSKSPSTDLKDLILTLQK